MIFPIHYPPFIECLYESLPNILLCYSKAKDIIVMIFQQDEYKQEKKSIKTISLTI